MKKIALYVQSVFYLAAGINHFRKPEVYYGLIPPYFSWHETINVTAGLAEIVLGFLLLFNTTRKWASYGIIVMLLLFIPSHIYFIQMDSCIPPGLCFPQWVGWLRLLLIHPILIGWAWWVRKA